MRKIVVLSMLLNVISILYSQQITYTFLRDSFGKFNDDLYEIKSSEIINM